MAKKSFLKICEEKPATKVLSVRIDAILHCRATEAVALASSLGFQLNLSEIISDCLLQAVTSAEKELKYFLMHEPKAPNQIQETLDAIVPQNIDLVASETDEDFSEEAYEY